MPRRGQQHSLILESEEDIRIYLGEKMGAWHGDDYKCGKNSTIAHIKNFLTFSDQKDVKIKVIVTRIVNGNWSEVKITSKTPMYYMSGRNDRGLFTVKCRMENADIDRLLNRR